MTSSPRVRVQPPTNEKSAHRHLRLFIPSDIYSRLPHACYTFTSSKASRLYSANLKLAKKTHAFYVWKIRHNTLVWPVTQPSKPHSLKLALSSLLRFPNHAMWNMNHTELLQASAMYGGPCVPRQPHNHTALPHRRKQHCICHLQFWEPPFGDRPHSVPVPVCFCVFLKDMAKAELFLSINKQLCE